MNTQKEKSFHIWVPDLFETKGGIRVFSTFLIRAIQRIYPFARYNVFVKLDRKTVQALPFLRTTRFHLAGRWPEFLRTMIFAAKLFWYGFWNPPDLIIVAHLNFWKVAYLLHRLNGVKYWVITYGIEAWGVKSEMTRQFLHHADRIFSISTYTLNRLVSENEVKPCEVTLLPNPVDAIRFQIAPKPRHLLNRFGFEENQPIILTVARLSCTERRKGYCQIIYALPKVRTIFPNLRYVLVGDGDDKKHVEVLIAKLDLGDLIKLAGSVADKELPDFYNLCDVFAMPSKKEGFGFVFLEAMASGKPVLAGNKDGSVDALQGGELGALVDPDDVDAIAQTLIQILQKKYPLPIMYEPEQLRQKVIEHFGFERFCGILRENSENFFKVKSTLEKS